MAGRQREGGAKPWPHWLMGSRALQQACLLKSPKMQTAQGCRLIVELFVLMEVLYMYLRRKLSMSQSTFDPSAGALELRP